MLNATLTGSSYAVLRNSNSVWSKLLSDHLPCILIVRSVVESSVDATCMVSHQFLQLSFDFFLNAALYKLLLRFFFTPSESACELSFLIFTSIEMDYV